MPRYDADVEVDLPDVHRANLLIDETMLHGALHVGHDSLFGIYVPGHILHVGCCAERGASVTMTPIIPAISCRIVLLLLKGL